MEGRSAAEEALVALARDLVEEISAARALEIASDPETLELAMFNVRPFQRLQRTRQGRVIPEEVHGHMATREGMAHPEDHDISPAQWAQGQREWESKGEAAWAKNRWKDIDKASEGIRSTHMHMFATGPDNDKKNPANHLWTRHGFGNDMHVQSHMAEASDRLREARGEQGQMDQTALADAYHHLHEAHRIGVEEVLSRAHTPEEQKNVHEHLQRIQGHMEHLDKVAGTSHSMTRNLLGSKGDWNQRAGTAQEGARHVAEQAAAQGDIAGVDAARGTGLLSPEHHQAFAKQAAQEAARQVAEANKPPIERNPPHAGGASAIYPQVGAHTVRLPGGTLSGHEFAHRATPFPGAMAEQPVHPDTAKLGQAQKRIESMQAAEATRKAGELQNHLAAMKALESERAGIPAPGEYAPMTDEQFAAHTKNLEITIENALRAGMATDQQYSLDGKGQVWSPERAMQHAEIIHEYMDKQVDVPSEKHALFLGGLPGAGKTSLLKIHPSIDLSNYAMLNPDDFKEILINRGMAPVVPGLSPLETAALIHEESAYLTDLAAAELERRGKNVAWDVTMKNHDITAARVQHMQDDRGYTIHGLFVDVPVEKSAQRVEKRYRKGLERYRQGTDPLGGRFIPHHIIMRGESEPGVSRARQTFDALKPHFRTWELYNGAEGKAQLVDRSGTPQLPHEGIPSVEALRKITAHPTYIGSTEAQARAAEKGTPAT